ncbi:hypothetical protein BOX15_Mlig003871g1 [Macrostomum lignano]|uniref:Uncharacterized protein n=1 Tax=Macrostomum lignano TaxID=282301 RepID=A0A267GRQ3_9PLAT|nr:hypothetical protein BOX15_Mlig003871g1 [Macrostomum lignano]
MPKSTRVSQPAMDPAYMKPMAYTASMETHDLGRRLSQAQLLQLASRNLNRSFEQGILAGVSSIEPRLSYPASLSASSNSSTTSPSSSSTSRPRRRVSSAANIQRSPLMSTSNADVARREAVLQGEFDIISRSHVVRYEQDSAFKKDRRVTPEIMALQNSQHRLMPRGRSAAASGRQSTFTNKKDSQQTAASFRQPFGNSISKGRESKTKETR